jgi:hypothetical protein
VAGMFDEMRNANQSRRSSPLEVEQTTNVQILTEFFS